MSDHRIPGLISKIDNMLLTRSSTSGSTTTSGSEVTFFEDLDSTYAFNFGGGWIDVSTMATGDTITVKVYVKIKSGGTYRTTLSDTYYDGQSTELLAIGGMTNVYGVKVTVTQSEGTYRTFDHEWYTAHRGA